MFRFTRVRSHSMAPTLRDGRLAPTRSLRPTTPVHRGDVVVAESAEVGGRVVKRVIGLPGETVTFTLGAVSIDGRPLAEPYAAPSVYTGEFEVPPGHYFLLGDNRDASGDSRTWRRPFLPRAALTGRVWTGTVRTGSVRTGTVRTGRQLRRVR